ncbi:Hexokinase [Olavius algarvensis spirochete endosymbiont]|uniref:hypothetical protein n=1 Tax=Olavius algarvensis spirochete endosymbiont TaxID=260710 RepID=UPI00052D4530|nr:hypothetical protein [Olavius algarvensis spirochete endosymbiont]KGM42753.1 hypothetical protein JY97_11810 [Alkalispirochaeta odontotermitis]VDB00594.1 Hexokinase [Olavius algarvensis spirochete endosymbiont]
MDTDKKSVDQFLTDVKMNPANIDLNSIVEHIVDEMTKGLNGKPSSLAMIPTYLEIDTDVTVGEKVVVLDAGGTNLRTATVHFDKSGKVQINNFLKQPMPGTGGIQVGSEEFFDSLANLIWPLLKEDVRKIGFCFSYPMEVYPNRDGRLIRWSKEVLAPDVEGEMMGACLKEALREKGLVDAPSLVMLNDTVSTVLTGSSSITERRDWGAYVGFILGTGTNSCYVESNSAIGKANGLNPNHSQVINCESGGLDLDCSGRADVLLCEETEEPESYRFEKMLSGRYFGPLVRKTISLAAEAELISYPVALEIEKLSSFSTRDADDYAHNPSNSRNPLVALLAASGGKRAAETRGGTEACRLWHLVDGLLERAAKLSAANLAAAVLKSSSHNGPLQPACIVIDGTTYYRYYRFAHRVESYLRPYLCFRDKYYEMVQVDDAPLVGAAVAALTNIQ